MDIVGREALARWLGDDLAELMKQIGGELESAEELTVLVSPRQRKASFKLTLLDGRVFKARRMKSSTRWASVVALSPLVENMPFAGVIAAHGMSCIEQWIPGTPLRAESVTPDQARRAGEVLGRLHTTSLPSPELLKTAPDGSWYRNRLDRHLAALVVRGALGHATARRIFTSAVEHQPATFEIGLIHGDFSADNIVIKDDGEIAVIDNESLRLAALDFDLARCRTRWPMTEVIAGAFVDGYQCYRSPETAGADKTFWEICALALTAYAQTNHNKPAGPVLDELRRLDRPNMPGWRGDQSR